VGYARADLERRSEAAYRFIQIIVVACCLFFLWLATRA